MQNYMLDMCAVRRTSGTKEDKHDLFSSLLDASDEDVDQGAKLTDRELLGLSCLLMHYLKQSHCHTLYRQYLHFPSRRP